MGTQTHTIKAPPLREHTVQERRERDEQTNGHCLSDDCHNRCIHEDKENPEKDLLPSGEGGIREGFLEEATTELHVQR